MLPLLMTAAGGALPDASKPVWIVLFSIMAPLTALLGLAWKILVSLVQLRREAAAERRAELRAERDPAQAVARRDDVDAPPEARSHVADMNAVVKSYKTLVIMLHGQLSSSESRCAALQLDLDRMRASDLDGWSKARWLAVASEQCDARLREARALVDLSGVPHGPWSPISALALRDVPALDSPGFDAAQRNDAAGRQAYLGRGGVGTPQPA